MSVSAPSNEAPTEPPTLDSTVGSTMPKRNGTTGNYESEF